MAKHAGQICKNADMTSPGRHLSADDLLVLLAVGRSGRYVTAADELGINHTTIARRIAALEQSMGGRLLTRTGGGWELTDLGRDALAAAESVEAAMRSLATDDRGSAHPGRRRTHLGHRRIQRLHRRTGGRRRAAPPSEGRRRDRRRHPPGQPAAFRSGHRGRGRRTPGAPRRGHPARRLPPGPLRFGGLSGRDTAPVDAVGPAAAPARLLHRLHAVRSTTWIWRAAWHRPCGNRSPPPTSSSMWKPPGRPRAWDCCRASWPTGIATWCACSRTTSPCS